MHIDYKNSPILQFGKTYDFQKEYDSFLSSFHDFSHLICPYCGCSNTLVPHSTYSRSIIHSPSDFVHTPRVEITILKCTSKSCQHHSALLPSWICPYSVLSMPFIIQILAFFYFESARNIKRTAEAFNLSRSTVRLLASRFDEEEVSLMETELLQQCRTDYRQFFQRLISCTGQLLFFLMDFIHKSARVFMMRQFPPSSYWSRIRCSCT